MIIYSHNHTIHRTLVPRAGYLFVRAACGGVNGCALNH
jgi:hypothetical protein